MTPRHLTVCFFDRGETPTPVRYADHLSPRRGERKGAKAGEFAPFLSPVDRGRGAERSEAEWGATLHPSEGGHP